MPVPTLPTYLNGERLAGSYSPTLQAGSTYEIPFYTFDLTTLSNFQIRFDSPSGSPTISWAIRAISSGGAPGTTIASGTISPASTGWYPLFTGQSYSVSPNTFYYLELVVTSGTSVKVVGNGYARMRTIGTNILLWDGTTLSIFNSISHWCLLYSDGSTWYGNPFPLDTSYTRTKSGVGYKLPRPVRLIGVSMHNWTNISLDTNIYIVRLWNINPDTMLPTTEITSATTPGWVAFNGTYNGNLTVVFNSVQTVQNFAVTVERENLTSFGTRELYAPVWSRVELMLPVRGIEWTGSSWSVLPNHIPIQYLWIDEMTETGGGTTVWTIPQHTILT